MKRPAGSQDLARFLSEVGAYMVIAARPAEFGILLAIGVGFAPLMAESAPAIKASAPQRRPPQSARPWFPWSTSPK